MDNIEMADFVDSIREVLRGGKGWTRGALVRRFAPADWSYCLLGAGRAAEGVEMHSSVLNRHPQDERTAVALGFISPLHVMEFNDAPDRTFDEVDDLLVRRSKELREKG